MSEEDNLVRLKSLAEVRSFKSHEHLLAWAEDAQGQLWSVPAFQSAFHIHYRRVRDGADSEEEYKKTIDDMGEIISEAIPFLEQRLHDLSKARKETKKRTAQVPLAAPEKVTLPWLFHNVPFRLWATFVALLASSFGAGWGAHSQWHRLRPELATQAPSGTKGAEILKAEPLPTLIAPGAWGDLQLDLKDNKPHLSGYYFQPRNISQVVVRVKRIGLRLTVGGNQVTRELTDLGVFASAEDIRATFPLDIFIPAGTDKVVAKVDLEYDTQPGNTRHASRVKTFHIRGAGVTGYDLGDGVEE